MSARMSDTCQLVGYVAGDATAVTALSARQTQNQNDRMGSRRPRRNGKMIQYSEDNERTVRDSEV